MKPSSCPLAGEHADPVACPSFELPASIGATGDGTATPYT
jgi:hypothetical protein